MRQWLIGGILIVGALLVFFQFGQPSQPLVAARQIPQKQEQSATLASSEQGESPTETTQAEVALPLVAEHIPDAFVGYAEMSQQDRLGLVSKVMHDKHLDEAHRTFLLAELGNKSLWPVTRNNIANALVWQKHSVAGLLDRFAAMIADESDDQTWREYSMQFYAQLAKQDLPGVQGTLWEYAQGENQGLAATAVLHLSLLEREHPQQPLPRAWYGRVVDLAASSEAPKRTRMTAITVIGHQALQEAAPTLRTLADDAATEPGLLRVSLAALGQCGTLEEDGPRVLGYMKHSNGAVVLAAKGAHKRLQQRFSQ